MIALKVLIISHIRTRKVFVIVSLRAFKKMCWFLGAISSGKLTALNKHASRECSRLVLICQMSQLKQSGLSVFLKDTT